MSGALDGLRELDPSAHVWHELVGIDCDNDERLVADGQISMEFAPEIR